MAKSDGSMAWSKQDHVPNHTTLKSSNRPNINFKPMAKMVFLLSTLLIFSRPV